MEKKELVGVIKNYYEEIAQDSHNIQQTIDENTTIDASFGSDEYELRANLNMAKSSLDSALKYIKYARAILEF